MTPRLSPHPPTPLRGAGPSLSRWERGAVVAILLVALSACATQSPEAVSTAPDIPGFWWGLWHGFVFPFAFVGSLFDPGIAVYAVPNRGGWYDFGFFLGITVLGGGSFFGSRSRK